MREDSLFPWQFGSMGQLGIVVEAKLDTVPCTPTEPVVGHTAISASTVSDEAGRLFWFTLFVSEASLGEARARLDALEWRYPDTFAFRNRYTYLIEHRRTIAPLLWPHPRACYAVGSWGVLKDTTARGADRVLSFDTDFTDMVLAHGYRRYVQSELPAGPELYARYFDRNIYIDFRERKRDVDPYNMFNREWVFP